LSVWGIYQKKGIIALIVGAFALLYILDGLRPTIGHKIWSIGLVSITVGFVVLTIWQVRSYFPAGGLGATNEKVISVQVPSNRTYPAAVEAVKDCGWKLIETKPEAGYLKARIGRSINTLYGQSFIITVNKVDPKSSSIKAQCSTLYQLMDYGRNNAMIEKFTTKLHERISANR
jgi:hypothetical protein